MAERKLSDEQFLAILRENAGIYARTARAIEKQFKVKYTRQSVRDRAAKFESELEDIYEENLDIAEEGLMTLMRKGADNVRIRAIEIFLKNKGRSRGYVEKSEMTLSVKELPQLPNILIKTREKND